PWSKSPTISVRRSAANAAAQLWLASAWSSWRWTPAKATRSFSVKGESCSAAPHGAGASLPTRRPERGHAPTARCATLRLREPRASRSIAQLSARAVPLDVAHGGEGYGRRRVAGGL